MTTTTALHHHPDPFFTAGLKVPVHALQQLHRHQEQEEAAGSDGGGGSDDADAASTSDADSTSRSSSSSTATIEDPSSSTTHPALVIPELLLQVLARVDPDTLVRGVPLTCRAWREAAIDPSLWRPRLDARVLAAVEGGVGLDQAVAGPGSRWAFGDDDGEDGEERDDLAARDGGRQKATTRRRAEGDAKPASTTPIPDAMLPRLYFGLYRRNFIRNPRFVRRLNNGGGGSGLGSPSATAPSASRHRRSSGDNNGSSTTNNNAPPTAWTVSNGGPQPAWECPPRGLSPHVFPPPPPLPHPSSCCGQSGSSALLFPESDGNNGNSSNSSGFFHRLFVQLLGGGNGGNDGSQPCHHPEPRSPRSWPTQVGGGSTNGDTAPAPAPATAPTSSPRPTPPSSPTPPSPRPITPCLASPAAAWCEVAQVVDLRAELVRRVPGLSARAAERLLDSGLALGLAVWVAAPEEASCAARLLPSSASAAASSSSSTATAPGGSRARQGGLLSGAFSANGGSVDGIAAATAVSAAARTFGAGPCPFALCLRLDEGAGPACGASQPPASTNPFAVAAAVGAGAGPPLLGPASAASAAAVLGAAGNAATTPATALGLGTTPTPTTAPAPITAADDPRLGPPAEPGRSPVFSNFSAFVRRPSAHHFYSRRLAAVPGQWRRFAYAVQVPRGCRRAVVLLRGRGPAPAGGAGVAVVVGAGEAGASADPRGSTPPTTPTPPSGVKFASAQLSFLPAGEVAAFGADECIAAWEERRLF